MNLPNKLSCFRMALVPLIVLVWIFPYAQLNIAMPEFTFGIVSLSLKNILVLVLFCIASFTDYLDGHIARKRGLVTNFGKFMDPLADKLLVCSALILLTAEGRLHALVTLIIVAREFIISGFRLIAADNGVVIAASKWGKLKTVTQMIMCVLLILEVPVFFSGTDMYFVVQTVMELIEIIAVLLTLISLVDYIAKNIRIITEGGM